MNKSSVGRIAQIDALRAFAVLLVVFSHSGLGDFVPGGAGVTIFFTISGFVITKVLLSGQIEKNFKIGKFYIARTAKIAPVLIFVVLLPSIFLALFSFDVSWQGIYSQTFFYYNWERIRTNPSVMPGTGVLWSLSIEEQFYIVFALFWLGIYKFQNWRLITLIAGVVVILGSFATRVFIYGQNFGIERIYFGTDSRAEAIAWGIVLALCADSLVTGKTAKNHITTTISKMLFSSNWTLAIALGFFTVSLLIRDEFFRQTFRFTFQSIAVVLVIGFVLSATNLRSASVFKRISNFSVVKMIGLASYSIYMTHDIVISLAQPYLLQQPLWATASLGSLLGVASGIFIYYLIEKPCQGLIKRKIKN